MMVEIVIIIMIKIDISMFQHVLDDQKYIIATLIHLKKIKHIFCRNKTLVRKTNNKSILCWNIEILLQWCI